MARYGTAAHLDMEWVEDWARNTVRGDESHTLLRNRATKIKA